MHSTSRCWPTCNRPAVSLSAEMQPVEAQLLRAARPRPPAPGGTKRRHRSGRDGALDDSACAGRGQPLQKLYAIPEGIVDEDAFEAFDRGALVDLMSILPTEFSDRF